MLDAATVKIKVEPDDKQRKPGEPAKSPLPSMPCRRLSSHPAENRAFGTRHGRPSLLLPGV